MKILCQSKKGNRNKVLFKQETFSTGTDQRQEPRFDAKEIKGTLSQKRM